MKEVAVRYHEVTSTHHLDAFNGLPGFSSDEPSGAGNAQGSE